MKALSDNTIVLRLSTRLYKVINKWAEDMISLAEQNLKCTKGLLQHPTTVK